jgi:hypothetical protein
MLYDMTCLNFTVTSAVTVTVTAGDSWQSGRQKYLSSCITSSYIQTRYGEQSATR